MPEEENRQTDVKPKGRTMSDEELLGLIRAYELSSLGSSVSAGATISTVVYPANQQMTTLELDRFNALNMYFARPLGNEIENRSQIVLPELRDTIEWIMPQLMRMFVAAKTVCQFDAIGPHDEEQAEMESAVVNHIFMQENNGFFVLHDFFKDALLMRNGYAEVYAKEEKETKVEKYTGLSIIELADLLQDKNDETIEVLSHKEYPMDVHMPVPQVPMQGLAPGQDPPVMIQQASTFDISIRRTSKRQKICVTCLPPEEMRITPRAREGMEDLVFSMHMTTKARSDLIADGYDPDWVNGLAAGRPNWMEMDALARNQLTDQLSVESSPSDRSMQEIELRRVIMRVDYDGDGVAELRRVIVGGDSIGENEEIEETPFASCVPKRMPHRHTGISLYDEISDLQVIKTTLFRQGLDNLTIANNQRVAVDWQMANFDDLLTSRPGGVVRGKGPPSNWIMPIEQPSNLVQQVLPTLEYIDSLKTVRTGVGQQTMGVDADDLQNVTKSAQLTAVSAASLKIELLARLLAEGVKDIFRKIHSALIRHQDKPMEFEISGKWVSVDPSQWRRRTKVSVNVGLGSGNREEMRQNIQVLTQAQAQLVQMGMVAPKQAFETFKVLCESLGFQNPERFAMDPDSAEYKQHAAQMAAQAANQPQAPQVQAAKIKAQSDQQIAQSRQQGEVVKLQGELETTRAKLVAEQTKAQAEIEHAAIQNHMDREIALDSNHAQLVQTLIRAIAPIIAAQLKGDPGTNAGSVLKADVQAAQ